MDESLLSHSGRIRVGVVRLLEQHRSMLRGLAFVLTGDHHVAEDAVQEVCLIVAADPRKVPAGDDDAARWLRAVLRNKALELGRKARRHRPMLAGDVLETLAMDFEHLDDASSRRHRRMCGAMAACLAGLSGDARLVVQRKYAQGEACETIAQQLGRSVQAVYAILKRVRISLADCVNRRLAAMDDQA